MSVLRNILVTGSNGLLGQKLVNLLAGREYMHVWGLSRGENRNPETGGWSYLSADVSDFDQLSAVFARANPTEVVHTAAMTNVDACEQNPDACRRANVDAVRYLCGLCKEHNARLIHISTDFIFDGANGPYRETDAPNPLSVYGRSKLEAERIIAESGVRAAILRTVLLYGVTPNMTRSNIVLWVIDSLRAGKPIRVVTDQYRTPTLAEDLAEASAAALFKDKTGVYHISGPDLMSIYDLALAVARHWNLNDALITPIETAELTQAAPRPPRTGFILLKAQTELAYKPRALSAGLALVQRQLQQMQS